MTDYTTLSNDLGSFFENTSEEFIDDIPRIIYNAHQKIVRKLNTHDITLTATGNFSTTNNSIPRPADMLTPKYLHYTGAGGKTTFVYYRQEAAIRLAYPTPTTSGEPEYFAATASNAFEVAPLPVSSYSYTIGYRGNIPAPSTTNATNVLLTQFYDVYLGMALFEAARWSIDDRQATEIATWGEYANSTLEELQAQDVVLPTNVGTF